MDDNTEFTVGLTPDRPKLELRARGDDGITYAGEWARQVLHDQSAGIVVGHREDPIRGHLPTRLPFEEVSSHTLIGGTVGCGGDRLMQSMYRQFIESNRAAWLVDVEGNHAEPIMKRLPEENLDDVSVWTPDDSRELSDLSAEDSHIISLAGQSTDELISATAELFETVRNARGKVPRPEFGLFLSDTSYESLSLLDESRLEDFRTRNVGVFVQVRHLASIEDDVMAVLFDEFDHKFVFNPGEENVMDAKVWREEIEVEQADLFDLPHGDFFGCFPKHHEYGVTDGIRVSMFDPLPPRRESEDVSGL